MPDPVSPIDVPVTRPAPLSNPPAPVVYSAGTTRANPRKAARRRSDRRAPSVVPSVHLVMILGTIFLIALGFIGHLLAPNDTLAVMIVSAGIGALFGKLSNGFGKSVPHLLGMPDRNGDGIPDDDGEQGDTTDTPGNPIDTPTPALRGKETNP